MSADALPDPPAAARRAATGLLLAFLAYACWGLLSPVGKHLLPWFGPLWLNAVRFLLATALLALWLRRSFGAGLDLLRDPHVLRVNLLANLSLTLFLYSLVELEATYATLGFYTAPLWTALLARLVLDERVGARFAVAVGGLLAGGYLALFGWAGPAGGPSAWGLTLAVASAVVWGWFTVDLRRHAPGHGLKPLVGAAFAIGVLWFLILGLLAEPMPDWPAIPASAWGWMGVHVAIPTLASFVLFNAAMQRAPASKANILVGAELAFTALFAWLLFDDRFTAAQVAGLAVVLGSVTWYLWAQARR